MSKDTIKPSKITLKYTRRDFLKNMTMSITGAGFITSQISCAGSRQKNEIDEQPGRKGGMVYRKLGRTNLKVSEIGLGGHYDGPLHKQKKSKEQWQRDAVFKECINLGINYFDSNTEYERKSLGQSIKAVPDAREKIYIVTDINDRMETGPETYDFMLSKFDEQLHNLQLPYVEVLRFTSVMKRTPSERIEAAIRAFKKIKKDGKAKYFAIGQHDPELLLEWINRYEEIDIIYTPYNYFAPRAGEELYPTAKKNDLGVIVIKPFNKGTIFNPKLIEMMNMGSGTRSIMDRVEKEKQDRKPEDLTAGTNLTLAQASLRYILTSENISMVIPGMETVDEVRENVQMAGSRIFSKSEKDLLDRYAINFPYFLPNRYCWLNKWKDV